VSTTLSRVGAAAAQQAVVVALAAMPTASGA
jgi:hypothetical protein